MSYTGLTGFRASDSIKYIYIRLGGLVSSTLIYQHSFMLWYLMICKESR